MFKQSKDIGLQETRGKQMERDREKLRNDVDLSHILSLIY